MYMKNLKLLLLTVLGTWMAGSAMAEEHYLVLTVDGTLVHSIVLVLP